MTRVWLCINILFPEKHLGTCQKNITGICSIYKMSGWIFIRLKKKREREREMMCCERNTTCLQSAKQKHTVGKAQHTVADSPCKRANIIFIHAYWIFKKEQVFCLVCEVLRVKVHLTNVMKPFHLSQAATIEPLDTHLSCLWFTETRCEQNA